MQFYRVHSYSPWMQWPTCSFHRWLQETLTAISENACGGAQPVVCVQRANADTPSPGRPCSLQGAELTEHELLWWHWLAGRKRDFQTHYPNSKPLSGRALNWQCLTIRVLVVIQSIFIHVFSPLLSNVHFRLELPIPNLCLRCKARVSGQARLTVLLCVTRRHCHLVNGWLVFGSEHSSMPQPRAPLKSFLLHSRKPGQWAE